MRCLLEHGHIIIDGTREYLDGAILIDDDRIVEVYSQSNQIKEIKDTDVIDLKNKIVMPGFFDTHCHGIANVYFEKPDIDGLNKASYEMLKSGTTSFLCSLSYDLDKSLYDKFFNIYNSFHSEYAKFEGLHLEGPFLNPKQCGAGGDDILLKPDLNILNDILSKTNLIKQMTIAYELDGIKEIVDVLHKNSIKVMCGHSDAMYEDLDDNVDGITHLFNAMRGLHHRDRTIINCAFEDKYYCEVIADGIHINNDMLRLLFDNIDRNKIMLVSDSSIARNLPDGEYEFLSKKCIKKGNSFKTLEGKFAGSVSSINDEIKILYSLGYKYTDLLLYSSLNAFRFYGLDKRYGSIEKGKYADLVIMDDDLNICDVYLNGKAIFK